MSYHRQVPLRRAMGWVTRLSTQPTGCENELKIFFYREETQSVADILSKEHDSVNEWILLRKLATRYVKHRQQSLLLVEAERISFPS